MHAQVLLFMYSCECIDRVKAFHKKEASLWMSTAKHEKVCGSYRNGVPECRPCMPKTCRKRSASADAVCGA